MPKNKSKISPLGALVLVIITMLLILFFWDKYLNRKINECPKVTIAYPTKYSGKSKIYYKFTLNGKIYEHSYTIPFPNMGKFQRGKHLLKERFWVKVNCNDYFYNKIYWDAKVPDTLQYIPSNGWDKIPYGLDEILK